MSPELGLFRQYLSSPTGVRMKRAAPPGCRESQGGGSIGRVTMHIVGKDGCIAYCRYRSYGAVGGPLAARAFSNSGEPHPRASDVLELSSFPTPLGPAGTALYLCSATLISLVTRASRISRNNGQGSPGTLSGISRRRNAKQQARSYNDAGGAAGT